MLDTKGWPTALSAYIVSKAALNAYTRIVAKKYTNFGINCVCPGFVKTELSFNAGVLTPDEVAVIIVRYAVVTGSNEGIGFETVRQLASKGINVVLTARDEKRGLEAVEKLKRVWPLSPSDVKIVELGQVNNAGIGGVIIDADGFIAAYESGVEGGQINWTKFLTETYALTEECLQINYYGAKKTAEALIPLLQLSNSPRIVNVSSSMGKLKKIPSDRVKGILSADIENLSEETVDQVLTEFLNDLKEGSLELKGWPTLMSGYTVSKAAMNAYTRILAKKYPGFCVNSVCPGYVKTDVNFNTGFMTVEEGTTSVVKYAVVTGANKGIGLETVRQLASKGITVALTARDEKRGLEAVEKLEESGLSGQVVFHQLDVADPSSIASLARFIKTQFGKLDILVNNAGIFGAIVDADGFRAAIASGASREAGQNDFKKLVTETYELAEECVQINYYGAKRTAEALIPLLQLSDSPRIVNVSSSMGKLQNIPSDQVKRVLRTDVENLSEEAVDQVLTEFLKDFKEGLLETKGWPSLGAGYTVSKAAMNAYTRILAKKYPVFRINSICPGYVKTDINFNTGFLAVEEGAASVVNLALLPNDGPTGLFFFRSEVQIVTGSNKGIGFETVRQLASNGITVVLTARDEKRGLETVEKLKEFGLSGQVVFHQLNVADPASIASLALFIKSQFGKLDILVNNAGIGGSIIDADGAKAAVASGRQLDWQKLCLQINYYGAKRTSEAFIPLLELSDSPRIVNVSSSVGKLKYIPSDRLKGIFTDVENLKEESIDEVLTEFLKNYKEGSLASKGWPSSMSGYTLAKASLNAYTRILAKKYPSFLVNCLCPGYVKTDFNFNAGVVPVEKGAANSVRLALLPTDGPSGQLFVRSEVSIY
ncbi:hypothetical protein ACLB2K_074168 [Fragaria x ananassa]